MSTQGQLGAARLERDAIGLAPVLFQSITHMAPAAAVAFSIIFATTYAGGSTPLAVVLALAGAIVLVLVYRGIRISTEAGVALGAFEIVVFLALAVTLIIAAGSNNTLSVFSPGTGNSSGLGSVFAGMVYTVLAFIGFEAAAPLGEEAKNPRRTIPQAVVWSCVLIGLFYLVCYYAATVYFGPSQMADPKNGFFGFNGGDPSAGLATKVWGPFSILVLLAIINSAIANSNAGANAATRLGFALGRAGILPRRLAAVHPRFKTGRTSD